MVPGLFARFLRYFPRLWEKTTLPLREPPAFFALRVRARTLLVEATMSERDLFIAALQIPDPAERCAWLDRECSGDAPLRQRLDVLLRALDQAGSLLEHPAVAPADTVGRDGPGAASAQATFASAAEGPPADQPGVVLAGRYKL